jgi:hypothetical protein
MCLVLTNEDSHTLNMTFAWRGLVLMTKEVCLAMKGLRNSTCSIIVLCVNLPPVVMSRQRSAMSRPIQKRRKITPSSNDKSRVTCSNVKNLAQAVPINSFSCCSKSRIALGRESIRDMGKKQDKTFP